MALEDVELDVGGTKFKGVYIAILFSFASTIGGGIWAASEFFSRLEAQEAAVQTSAAATETLQQRFEDLKSTQQETLSRFQSQVDVMKTQLADNDIGGLQSKLTELGTNLKNIMEAQSKLLDLREGVEGLERQIIEMQTTVQKAEAVSSNAAQIQASLTKVQKEIDDIWEGMDYLANPLGN